MRKLILFMHVSLDGFAAGPNGEMDWIRVDDEILKHVESRIHESNAALYGRVTYEMMEGYWPTAADQPNATWHDVEHSRWYEQASKIVLSRTLTGARQASTRIIGDDLAHQIRNVKQEPGTDILIFGSPGACHSLMAEGLIDDYWLFVNPILLARGVPAFQSVRDKATLTLAEHKVFASGVVCLRYTTAVPVPG